MDTVHKKEDFFLLSSGLLTSPPPDMYNLPLLRSDLYPLSSCHFSYTLYNGHRLRFVFSTSSRLQPILRRHIWSIDLILSASFTTTCRAIQNASDHVSPQPPVL